MCSVKCIPKLNIQCAGLECVFLVLLRRRLALRYCWGRDTGGSGSWEETGYSTKISVIHFWLISWYILIEIINNKVELKLTVLVFGIYKHTLPVTDLLHFLANLVSPVRDQEHHTLGRLSLHTPRNGELQKKMKGWKKSHKHNYHSFA